MDRLGEYDRVLVEGQANEALTKLIEVGADIQSVVPKRDSLEDLFVKESKRNVDEGKAA